MVPLDNFRGRHSDLASMISDLQQMLTPEQLSIRPNAETAHRLLCSLADKMKEHLAETNRQLYPEMLTHQDPNVKSVAWGFINGEKPLRKLFDDYHKKWLKDCDFQFTQEFIQESNEVFSNILRRIEREENVLFPKLEHLGDSLSARA